MKILHVVSSLNTRNGIANVIMGFIRNNNSNINYEILCLNGGTDVNFNVEISNLNIPIHYFDKPTIKSFISSKRKMKSFFKQNKYDIIHCHLPPLAKMILSSMDKHTKFIIHSHNVLFSERKIANIRNKFLYIGVNRRASYRIACSKPAGDFQFKNFEYTVINNPIDYKKFKFNEIERKKLRNEYSVNGKKVIGHVGRFSSQKNQVFLIKVMQKLVKIDNDFMLFFIGGGEQKNILDNLINQYGLGKNIILLEQKNNINTYYNMFDSFAFPSIFEGLGLVAVEAQYNGLDCIMSLFVPEDVKITENLLFLPLNVDDWVDKLSVLNIRTACNPIINDPFEPDEIRKKIHNIYMKVANNK